MIFARVVGGLAAVLLLSQCAPAPASRVLPSPVVAKQAPSPPVPFGPKTIDAMMRAEWQKAGVSPSPAVDDAAFLRRVYIDVLGTIPSADAVLAFEADTSKDKRDKLVTQLLASPSYAETWAIYWDDVLMGRAVRDPRVDRVAFRTWLKDQFAANVPWDKIVYALVSAAGQNSAGGSRRTQAYGFGMSAGSTAMTPAADDAPAAEAPRPINGAVNWLLKYADAPQDFAGSTSKTFLGVQIQCAQCHDHKTEKWTQTDFQRFASCFTRTQLVPIDPGPAMGNIRRFEVRDLPRPAPRIVKNAELRPIAQAHPAALDGTDFSAVPNARDALARWITAKQNPWFPQAIVNRMWAHFLGRGFVDPIDDLRVTNPATMPAILDKIAADFAQHDYDLKYLIKLITETEAYARSAAPGPSPKPDLDHKTWARFRIAPLGPEELLHAVLAATNLEEAIRRAGSGIDLDAIRQQLARQYGFLFDVDEEFDHDAFEGTLAQMLTLLNGSLTGSGSSALPGSALSDVLARPDGDREKVQALYLRVLSRRPTAEESAYWLGFVTDDSQDGAPRPAPRGKQRPPGSPDPLRRLENKAAFGRGDAKVRAYEDMVWALLNSSEFLFNH